MAKAPPSYLRLYREREPAAPPPPSAAAACLAEVCRNFELATGWPLEYVPGELPGYQPDLLWSAPVNPGVGIAPGPLRIGLGGREAGQSRGRLELDVAGPLAASVAQLAAELLRAQYALWQREAELAAGVPLVPHRREQEHLAARLEAVLKGGADAIGCQAAALYLLDSATTELKLRAAWCFPLDRFTAPARALREATADLEALAGHAVVLEQAALFAQWNPPEDYAAAVCVPVSSPTLPLGTLWVFSHTARCFTDQQVNIVEVVAGRLAADLEREMLLAEATAAAQSKRLLADAARLQRSQLPRIAPLADGWDLAGWTLPRDVVGGGFHDWFVRADGILAVAVGNCAARGIEAALSAAALRAALRAHAEYASEPGQLLEQVNRTLWTSSAGDQVARLFCGFIAPESGTLRYAAAGEPAAILLGPDGWQSLAAPSVSLGLAPSTGYLERERQIEPGEVLVVASEGVCHALDGQGRPLGEGPLAQALVAHREAAAQTLSEIARDRLDAHRDRSAESDATVLVAKRRALA